MYVLDDGIWQQYEIQWWNLHLCINFFFFYNIANQSLVTNNKQTNHLLQGLHIHTKQVAVVITVSQQLD